MQKVLTSFIITAVLSLILSSAAFSVEQDAKYDCGVCDEDNQNRERYLIAAVLSESESEDDEEDDSFIDNKRIRIINLGPIINHGGYDYAPTVSADGRTLFYVSTMPGSKLTDNDDLSHDFWAAKKNDRLDTVFFKPFNIDTTTSLGDASVNTRFNEGAASIAPDRQSLYFTACSRPDGIGDCDIYVSKIRGDVWERPINLGRKVNSKWWDSQPSISPFQDRLYFCSNRPGPNGDENFDIWYSDRDIEFDEWKEAKPLKAINTPGRERSPFIAADGRTLFFASDSYEPNYGDQDFYYTTYNPDTDSWSKPVNLGRPINTEGREEFITLPASADIIYFSSTRQDLPSYQGSLDIFMAFVPSFFQTVIVKGTVFDECSQEFIPAQIEVKNPITGRIYKDSLTSGHQEFELIVANQDYGVEENKHVNLEITAYNPKYGKNMVIQRVDKPEKTKDVDKANQSFKIYEVRIPLGQMPVLATDIDEAEHVRTMKIHKPELASFRGLVMKQVQTWDLYPLLNYVFFDLGKSNIDDRYILFDDPSQTEYFSDTTIPGGTLEKYYHLLNIYGFRLQQYPDTKIEIVGCNDGTTSEEKAPNLSKERATNVYNYLKDIWGISEDRMKLVVRNKPQVVSNLRDSLGIVENRRVEIISDDWNIMKPVFEKDAKKFPQPEKMDFILTNGIEDALIANRRIEIMRGNEKWNVLSDVGLTDKVKKWDWKHNDASVDWKYPEGETPYTCQLVLTTNSGAECKSDPIQIPVMQVAIEEKDVTVATDSTLENYNLILFPFDRSDAGPINERIMRDYVYKRILPESVVEVIGHTDVVGLYEHNKKLSVRRSNTVVKGIKKETNSKYSELNSKGVGEDEALYDNSLPEGRFYNRTVQVKIRTPLEAWENIKIEEAKNE